MSSSWELRHKCHVIVRPMGCRTATLGEDANGAERERRGGFLKQELQLCQNAYYSSMNSVSEAAHSHSVFAVCSTKAWVFSSVHAGVYIRRADAA